MLHGLGLGIVSAAAFVPEIPTTGLTNHYLSGTGVTESSSLVSAWADQVGSRGLAEATNKPTIVASQIDGYPSIRFDGVNDILKDTSGNKAQGFHVFMVLNQISWTANDHVFSESTDVFNPALEQQTTSPQLAINGSAASATGGATLGTWSLIGTYFSGTSSYVQVNGTKGTVGGGTPNDFSGGIALGGRGASVACSNVEFAEVAIYSSERTGTPLDDIEAYFAAKYPTLSIA